MSRWYFLKENCFCASACTSTCYLLLIRDQVSVAAVSAERPRHPLTLKSLLAALMKHGTFQGQLSDIETSTDPLAALWWDCLKHHLRQSRGQSRHRPKPIKFASLHVEEQQLHSTFHSVPKGVPGHPAIDIWNWDSFRQSWLDSVTIGTYKNIDCDFSPFAQPYLNYNGHIHDMHYCSSHTLFVVNVLLYSPSLMNR